MSLEGGLLAERMGITWIPWPSTRFNSVDGDQGYAAKASRLQATTHSWVVAVQVSPKVAFRSKDVSKPYTMAACAGGSLGGLND